MDTFVLESQTPLPSFFILMSKTPRIGDLFTYDGQSYKVVKVPTFSSVVGRNLNVKSGMPDSIKVPIREIEIYEQT